MAKIKTVQRRYERHHQKDASQELVAFAAPPKITYGKPNKPLPLKGTHFRFREDVYDISADQDEQDEAAESESSPAQKKARRRTREPSPGESPLSEDDLEAVYGQRVSPVRSLPSSPQIPTSSSKTSLEVQNDGRVAALNKKGVAKTIPTVGVKNVHVPGRKTAAIKTFTTKTTINANGKSSAIDVNQQPPKPPARRLPVQELLLVPAEQREETRYNYDPPASAPGIETQDPIAISSSPLKRRRISPTIEEHTNRRGTLTSIRKRLKTPQFTHKSVVTLRKKQRQRNPFSLGVEQKLVLGDGFDSSELRIGHRIRKKMHRKTPKPLLLGFSALDLGKGPLPEVKFENSSSELCLGLSDANDALADPMNPSRPGEIQTNGTNNFARKAARKVSFSDRVKEDMVMAKLSSVSAPVRTYSISSDEGDESDDDMDDEHSHTDRDHQRESEPRLEDDEEEDFVETDEEDEPLTPQRTPPSNQNAIRRSSYWSDYSKPASETTPNSVVTLNFRDRTTPGFAPKTPFGKRRLMEVNEAIVDEPLLQQYPITIYSTQAEDEQDDDDYMLDSEPPPPPDLSHLRRPRSILRKHTPAFQERDTRPEATAANTRRNSMIASNSRRNSMINPEESQYFATAANMLQQPPSQPRIIKSKTSDRRHTYREPREHDRDHHREVQVPDSETAVLETSQLPDYVNNPTTNLLKRTSDTYWTSSESLPKAPVRDLWTLTRTISREAGTLSQAVRRRPSLQFQSPTKVRR